MPKILIPSIKELSRLKGKLLPAFFGLLLALSAPGYGMWFLAWLALIPALRCVRSQAEISAVLWGGFLLGFVFQGLYCLWFFDLHPLTWLGFTEGGSRLVTLAGWLLIASEGGVLVALLLAAYRKLPPGWPRPFLFALAWVSGFSLLHWTPMALPWGLLEYTQAGLWPMRWLAGTVTASGITFLLVLHNACWAEWLPVGLRRLSVRPVPWQGLIVVAGPLLIPALLILAVCCAPPAKPGPLPMPVGVVQAGLPIEVIRSAALTPERSRAAYLDPIRQAGWPPGTLAVLPEEGVVSGWVPEAAPFRNPRMAELRTLAREKHIRIGVGVSSVDQAGHLYNAIALLLPETASVQFYRKRRLVPFGEFTPYGLGPTLESLLAAWDIGYSAPYASGHEGRLLQAGPVRVGGMVCFELIDASPAQGGFAWQYRHAGAQLLMNTSNLGWFHENPLIEAQFLAIGQMRAAETRLPLIIASNTGISAILSDRGDILTRTRPGNAIPGKSQLIFYPSHRTD